MQRTLRDAGAFALLVLGLVLSMVAVPTARGDAADMATPVAMGAVYDSSLPLNDEGRAMFGNIFIGTVVAVAGRDRILSSDPEDPGLPVIIYDVDVEQTLQGEATGRVRIWYEGFDHKGEYTVDGEPVGELAVGERYLFFAGFNPDEQWYPVNASIGVLAVKNDRAEAELVARFAPLIRQAARQADQPPAPDPCEQAGRPAVSVEPPRAQPGDTVRLSGRDFVRPQVSVWWDGFKRRLATADVDATCAIAVDVTVPADEPGEHRLIVQDARGARAEAVIVVTAD